MKVRRAAGLLFSCRDGRTLDIAELLSGKLATVPQTRLYAMSPASGAAHRINRDELELLLAMPADGWADSDGHATEMVSGLLERGLLVADGSDARDERLRASGWERHAAVYHFMTRWRGVDIRDDAGDVTPANEEHVRAFLELNGPPPPAFRAAREPAQIVDLPEVGARLTPGKSCPALRCGRLSRPRTTGPVPATTRRRTSDERPRPPRHHPRDA